MPRCTFQKGSQIQERKKTAPRNGVIVSADPAFKGQKHHWLVQFDGEDEPVARSSSQLLHRTNTLDSSTSTNTNENIVSCEDDDDWFVAQDTNDYPADRNDEELSNNTLQEFDSSDETEEEDPDTVLIDDIIENHGEESNPYIPNATDMEDKEIHARKWIEYNKDKQKLVDEAYAISVVPSIGKQK